MADTIEKVSIIVSKGSLDGVYPGLIMANGARAEGIEANLFFTFFGLDAIHRVRHDNIKLATAGSPPRLTGCVKASIGPIASPAVVGEPGGGCIVSHVGTRRGSVGKSSTSTSSNSAAMRARKRWSARPRRISSAYAPCSQRMRRRGRSSMRRKPATRGRRQLCAPLARVVRSWLRRAATR